MYFISLFIIVIQLSQSTIISNPKTSYQYLKNLDKLGHRKVDSLRLLSKKEKKEEFQTLLKTFFYESETSRTHTEKLVLDYHGLLNFFKSRKNHKCFDFYILEVNLEVYESELRFPDLSAYSIKMFLSCNNFEEFILPFIARGYYILHNNIPNLQLIKYVIYHLYRLDYCSIKVLVYFFSFIIFTTRYLKPKPEIYSVPKDYLIFFENLRKEKMNSRFFDCVTKYSFYDFFYYVFEKSLEDTNIFSLTDKQFSFIIVYKEMYLYTWSFFEKYKINF